MTEAKQRTKNKKKLPGHPSRGALVNVYTLVELVHVETILAFTIYSGRRTAFLILLGTACIITLASYTEETITKIVLITGTSETTDGICALGILMTS